MIYAAYCGQIFQHVFPVVDGKSCSKRFTGNVDLRSIKVILDIRNASKCLTTNSTNYICRIVFRKYSEEFYEECREFSHGLGVMC